MVHRDASLAQAKNVQAPQSASPRTSWQRILGDNGNGGGP